MKNLFFFFLLCTLILPSAFAQEKLNLRLQLQLNDRYRIVIPMDMPTDISMSVDEAKMKAFSSIGWCPHQPMAFLSCHDNRGTMYDCFL